MHAVVVACCTRQTRADPLRAWKPQKTGGFVTWGSSALAQYCGAKARAECAVFTDTLVTLSTVKADKWQNWQDVQVVLADVLSACNVIFSTPCASSPAMEWQGIAGALVATFIWVK